MKTRRTTALRFSIAALCALVGLLSVDDVLAQRRVEGTPSVCAAVVRIANANVLERTIARSGGTLLPPDDAGRRLPSGQLDLDGDGRADTTYVDVDQQIVLLGDQQQPLQLTQDPAVDWSSADFRWPTVLGFLTIEGRAYIAWSRDDSLSYLSRVTSQRVHEVVCQFVEREEPSRNVSTGRETVCKAVSSRNVGFVAFDEPHSVTDLERPETSPSPRAARIDIDNDGADDYVIQTRYASGRGQGCDIDGLAILNDARTAVSERAIAKLLEAEAETCGDKLAPFTFAGRAYFELRRAGARRLDSVLKIEDGQRQQVCEISVAPVYAALSDYERLVRAAKTAYRDLWEHAFTQPGVSAAELLLRNGHSIDETIRDGSLLTWAVWRGRQDLFDWLLAHGADPKPPAKRGASDTPLGRALAVNEFDMAARLIEAGADPEPLMYQIADSVGKNGEAARPVIVTVIKRLGYIPQEMLEQAARSRSPALDDLASSGLPVQLLGIEWQGGRRVTIPPSVSAEFAADPTILGKVTGVFEGVLPPPTRFAVATYGTYVRGWRVQRYGDSSVSDDEFLMFATSFCVHFLDVDCGPPELVSRARTWAENLNLECSDDRLAGKVDAVACSVGTYYANVANVEFLKAVLIFPINERFFKEGSVMMTRADLRDLYAAKHARQ